MHEARKSPLEQVEDHLSGLTDPQRDKLGLRCAELCDDWGLEPEADGDAVAMARSHMGDRDFLSMLRRLVPLTAPKPRDMGANTFVARFFEQPFDQERFLGRLARDRGIPYSQAKEEWERANLDRTHVGRYAHMLADDAVNGRPPSKTGENPREVAIYEAIYAYAANLVRDASFAESEVPLHASSATLGGKFDLLMKKGGRWILVDWKTNGEDLGDVPTGKVGLDELVRHLNDNPYNRYALQLNVYEWAAKDSGRIPMAAEVSKELHHFQYNGDGTVKVAVVKVPDLQELVQAMVDRAISLGVVQGRQQKEIHD